MRDRGPRLRGLPGSPVRIKNPSPAIRPLAAVEEHTGHPLPKEIHLVLRGGVDGFYGGVHVRGHVQQQLMLPNT